MGKMTTIEWTTHIFNPWWGCQRVSAGCAHCYAERNATRFHWDVWGSRAPRRHFSDTHWQEPVRWNNAALRAGQRARVFCASMADVFEAHPDVADDRTRLWHLIESTPMLDWLLLTKRPESMHTMTPWWSAWPDNVWALTSVEMQPYAALRIPPLVTVPAVVRGLSVEPLLGPIDLMPWLSSLQWVIVGGESGPRARPMHPDWVRSLRDQCRSAGVPFFFKQWGGPNKKTTGRALDGRTWDQVPVPGVQQ